MENKCMHNYRKFRHSNNSLGQCVNKRKSYLHVYIYMNNI